jgi:pimeloyl-ACP methyl ester carboxylesterase
MRHTLQLFIAFVILGPFFGLRGYPADTSSGVEILDRSGSPVTHITDGDTIRLRLTLPAAGSPQTYTFRLDDLDLVVATCEVASGSSCQTEPVLSLGWHWDAGGVVRDARTVKAYDADGSLVAQSATLTVRPRPVVMVHGFVSSWETWKPYLGAEGFLAPLGLQGFAVGDGQVPGKMNTGALTNPTGRTNTIAQNAAVEAEYIAAVKKQTGAQMVDLVVHSMGGMISRYYIDRLMSGRDVAQLVMLGSPMGGSDCSVLAASLGFYLPGSIEIRQSYMQGVFNRQITHRRGVEFYDLGGTAISKPFQSPCAPIPNDIAVSFDSINAIPLQSSRFDILHTELTSSPAVFQQFVQPLLEKPAGSFTEAPDPAASAAALAPLPFTRVYTGHVPAGGSTDVTIRVDANLTVASFAMYDPTRSIDVSVRGASGNTIQLSPQTNGFVRVTDPASLVYLGYGFANPKPGIWHVTVLATGATPAAGADYAISVYFVGGALLDARSSTLVPREGEAVRFTANLTLGGQPLQISKAQAVIRAPDGATETIDFSPGSAVSASWTPRIAGTHGVDIVVTGIAPDGTQIERTAFLAEEVQPNPSKLQVSANLGLVILVVLAVLALLVFVTVRLARRLVRRPPRG